MTAAVRTIVQAALAWLLSVGWIDQTLTWATEQGISINLEAVETALFLVVLGAVTAAVNRLGQKYPILNRIISLGRARAGPHYD